MNCLALCLSNLTWYRKWEYSHRANHSRKQQIKDQWEKIWYSVKYKTGKRPTDQEYIEIYNTWRWTTHAVVQKWKDILYNPYWVKDLLWTNWFITVEKI